MSNLKNGVTLRQALNQLVMYSTAVLLTCFISTASADDYYPCNSDPYYVDPCCPDTCYMDMCDTNYMLYGDFIYWQVHPEGLEFARRGGFGDSNTVEASERGCIFAPKCKFEPGFRVGLHLNLGCCNWDFYGQYTYLFSHLDTSVSVAQTVSGLRPLIWNETYAGNTNINLARGEWENHFNVFDFGLGRTFDVNCCFDFRPHLGFKATWQELKYTVTYEEIVNTGLITRTQSKMKIDFDGIGLRSGFDAAWRFSPCFRIMGGMALSAVFSDLCSFREDNFTNNTTNPTPTITKNVDLKYEKCVLIPVAELLIGVRFDQNCCGCYDFFVFAGWEHQIWWNLNQFIFVGDSNNNNSYVLGANGGVTYQGLTVRGGVSF
ncbi:MAG: hypothetical protein K940chlam3_01162 [Chlamydiae bacterium]|nr:hypothetical protein [Chlamydiota bacterium]